MTDRPATERTIPRGLCGGIGEPDCDDPAPLAAGGPLAGAGGLGSLRPESTSRGHGPFLTGFASRARIARRARRLSFVSGLCPIGNLRSRGMGGNLKWP